MPSRQIYHYATSRTATVKQIEDDIEENTEDALAKQKWLKECIKHSGNKTIQDAQSNIDIQEMEVVTKTLEWRELGEWAQNNDYTIEKGRWIVQRRRELEEMINTAKTNALEFTAALKSAIEQSGISVLVQIQHEIDTYKDKASKLQEDLITLRHAIAEMKEEKREDYGKFIQPGNIPPIRY
jgi:uncharacterized coiled-coil DUF342 family protein